MVRTIIVSLPLLFLVVLSLGCVGPRLAAPGALAGEQSGTDSPSGAPGGIGLRNAFNQGMVEGELRGRDVSGSDTVMLTLRKVVPQDIEVTVSTGSILINEFIEGPDLVLNRLRGLLGGEGEIVPSETINLTDNAWHEYILEAYSLDAEEGAADSNSTFTLMDPVETEFVQVLEAADQLSSVSSETIQVAVWSITNGLDQNDVVERGFTPDLEILRALFEQAGLDPTRKRLFNESSLESAQGYASRGNAYFELGEYIQAVADYTEAISLEPDFTEALYRRGLALAQSRRFSRAIEDFTKVTQLHPQHALGYFGLGTIYSSQPDPDFDKAIDKLTQAVERDSEFGDAYYARGLAHAARENLDEAIADFSKSIHLDPEFVDAYYARGTAYGSKQEFDQALKDFTRALELNPSFPEALRARGLGYLAIGKKDEAIDDFQKYLTLRPESADHDEVKELVATLRGEPHPPAPGEIISLTSAVQQGLVQVEFQGLGVASGDSILLRVQQETSTNLLISVTPGMTLTSSLPGEMDMVVRGLRGVKSSDSEFQPVEYISLTDDRPQEYFIEAYSIDFAKSNPSPDSTLFVGGTVDHQVLRVLNAVDIVRKVEGDLVSIQTAIWVVTNDVDGSDLASSRSNPDLEVVRALLKAAGIDPQCKKLFGQSAC